MQRGLGGFPHERLHQDTVWLCVSIDRLDYFAHPTLIAIFFLLPLASCLLPFPFLLPSAFLGQLIPQSLKILAASDSLGMI